MTAPLTIKDLNCSTCPNRIIAPIGSRVCTILTVEHPDSYQIGIPFYQEVVGCASHPLALQVLAAPVIKELEKCITTWNENLQPSDDYESGIISGLDVAIKLLHGDTQ